MRDCQPNTCATVHLLQLLWTVKLLPFSCRAEKWFYLARRKRSVICASSVSQEQYLELLQQLHANNMNTSSDQQRMIDQVCVLWFAS